MRTTPLGALSRLVLLVGVSALAGVLVAGLAFPLIGGAGLAARAGADSFDSLPSELKTAPLPQRSTILAADGTPIATIYLQNRVVVPLSAVPVAARQAVIAIEDSRFYEHHGVDYKGLIRALVENQRAGEVRQGGSTLTQQYVKNVLIEQARTKQARQAATERSTSRKLREARYALALEEKLSKSEILERYLNIAYFGSGAYGIATAAQRYFGKRPSKLTLAEAALLAGLVKNPTAYDPTRNRARPAVERRNVVLNRMRELGFITPAQEAAALKAPVKLHLTTVPNGCTGASIAPFFCDYVVRQLKATPGIGSSRLLRGGLVVRTTLDLKVQKAAQYAVDKAVERTNRVAMAAVVVEPGTGEVKAMAVSRGFGKSTRRKGYTEVPLAIRAAYQGGSTFKAFTLAAMLERGVPLSLSLECPAQYRSQVFKKGPGLGPYEPRNAGDSESGFFDVPTAMWESVNTCFVQYIERIGVAPVARMAERLGSGVEAKKVGANQGSFTLGTYDVSPLGMATAYATLAAHGLRCRPRPLLTVQAPGTGLVQLPPKDCEQVLEPRIADTVTDVLRGVIEGPAAGRTGRGAYIGRPAAGKTGTTNNSAAAWFVGYTPQLAAAIWMGDPRGNKYGMRGVRIKGRTYRQVYGGTIAAPTWARLMKYALEGEPVQRFRAPDESLYGGRSSPIPDVTGLTVASAREALHALGYGVRVSDRRVYAFPIAAGLVGRTYPLPGVSLPPGETVVLYRSNGGLPPKKPSPTPSPSASPKPTASSTPTPTPAGTAVPLPQPKPSKKRCPPGKPNC